MWCAGVQWACLCRTSVRHSGNEYLAAILKLNHLVSCEFCKINSVDVDLRNTRTSMIIKWYFNVVRYSFFLKLSTYQTLLNVFLDWSIPNLAFIHTFSVNFVTGRARSIRMSPLAANNAMHMDGVSPKLRITITNATGDIGVHVAKYITAQISISPKNFWYDVHTSHNAGFSYKNNSKCTCDCFSFFYFFLQMITWLIVSTYLHSSNAQNASYNKSN